MFTKFTIALAVILGITSGALAETKRQHSTKPTWDSYNALAQAKRQHSTNPAWDVYNGQGVYVGSIRIPEFARISCGTRGRPSDCEIKTFFINVAHV